jgi:hypothetical protein
VQRYDLLNLDQLAEQEDLEKNKHHSILKNQQQQHQQQHNFGDGTDNEVVNHYGEKVSISCENNECVDADCQTLVQLKKDPPSILTLPIKHHAPIIPTGNVLMLDDFGYDEDDYYTTEPTQQSDDQNHGDPCLQHEDVRDDGNPNQEGEQSFDFSSFWNSTDIFRDGLLKIEDPAGDEENSDNLIVNGKSEIADIGEEDTFSKRVLATFLTIPHPLNFFDDIEDSINLDDDPILKKVAENKVNKALQAAQFFAVPPVDESTVSSKGNPSLSSSSQREINQEASLLAAVFNFLKFCKYQFSLAGNHFHIARQSMKSSHSSFSDKVIEWCFVLWMFLKAIIVICGHLVAFLFQVLLKCVGIHVDMVSFYYYVLQ